MKDSLLCFKHSAPYPVIFRMSQIPDIFIAMPRINLREMLFEIVIGEKDADN